MNWTSSYRKHLIHTSRVFPFIIFFNIFKKNTNYKKYNSVIVSNFLTYSFSLKNKYYTYKINGEKVEKYRLKKKKWPFGTPVNKLPDRGPTVYSV